MSFALLYSLVRFLLDALLTRSQSDLRLRAEVLALRHQLQVLERQVRRPRWQPADRLLLTALSRALPRPAWSALLVSPETLLRWHRELIRGKWEAYARRSPRPDRTRTSELHQLILRLARETVASNCNSSSSSLRSRVDAGRASDHLAAGLFDFV